MNFKTHIICLNLFCILLFTGCSQYPSPKLLLDEYQANLLTKLENKSLALDKYNQIIQNHPSYAEAYSNLGVILDGLNKSEDAIKSLKEALELATLKKEIKNIYYINFNLGTLYGAEGKFAEALDSYQAALEALPTSIEAKTNIELLIKNQQQEQQQKDQQKDQKNQDEQQKDEQNQDENKDQKQDEQKQDQKQNDEKKDQNKEGSPDQNQNQNQNQNQDKNKDQSQDQKPQDKDQQNQDQKQDEQKQDQQQKEQQDSKEQDNKEPKESDPPKPSEKKYQGSAKYKPRPFKGEQLSEGDVKKILGELLNQEQKIRSNFDSKNKEGGGIKNDKDW